MPHLSFQARLEIRYHLTMALYFLIPVSAFHFLLPQPWNLYCALAWAIGATMSYLGEIFLLHNRRSARYHYPSRQAFPSAHWYAALLGFELNRRPRDPSLNAASLGPPPEITNPWLR